MNQHLAPPEMPRSEAVPSSGTSAARPEPAATRRPTPSVEPRPASVGFRSRLTSVVSWLPPVLVVCGLAGVAWYGHHHDWKLPPVASVIGGASDGGVTWCASHGVPEAECIVCDPSLIEPSPTHEFCDVHGVHGCVLHQPELAQTKTPIEPTQADHDRAERALALLPRPENLPISSSAGARVQFASLDAMRKAGVDVEPVFRSTVTESIGAAGEIRYDETKTAWVSPAADGIVRRVVADIGDWVDTGDLLAVVDCQQLGRLKSTLLSAILEERLKRVDLTRLQRLAPSGAIPARRVIEVQTDLQQATVAVEQAVRGFTNLGLQVDLERLRSADADEATSIVRDIGTDLLESNKRLAASDDRLTRSIEKNDNLLAVTAPLQGRIVERLTTVGEVVDRGGGMFRIADTRTVWLDLRVPAEDASHARIGMPVRYQPDGSTQPQNGSVTWISSDVDRQTRTVRVRAELPNEDGQLRNESFGHGEIILRPVDDAIVVPENAVQWDGASHLVFVRDARFFDDGRPKFFVARSVRPGARQDGMIEIIAGVLPGEVVASQGSDVLRAQLLRGNLGAGCTCGL